MAYTPVMRWTPIRIMDTLAPLAVALLVVALAGCESTLEVEVPAPEPQLVVNSLFTNDDQWIVEVSRSANAFGGGDLRERRFTISSAAVTVQSPEDEAPLSLAYTDTLTYEPFSGRQRPLGGVYTALDRAPDAVGPYTIRVEARGFDPVEATGRIPPMVPASASSTARPVPDPFVDPPTVQQQRTITLRLHDPAGDDNYYQVQLVRVGGPDASDRGPATFETRDRSILDDAPAELEDEGQFTGTQAYFADPLFDGQTHEIDLVVEEFIDPKRMPIRHTRTSFSGSPC